MDGKIAGPNPWRDPQLQLFYLKGVTATGKTLGIGSYGTVLEVMKDDQLAIVYL